MPSRRVDGDPHTTLRDGSVRGLDRVRVGSELHTVFVPDVRRPPLETLELYRLFGARIANRFDPCHLGLDRIEVGAPCASNSSPLAMSADATAASSRTISAFVIMRARVPGIGQPLLSASSAPVLALIVDETDDEHAAVELEGGQRH